MKKILSFVMLAATLAVSCQKENIGNSSSELRTVTVQAVHEFGAPSKVTIGDVVDNVCPVLWQTGDEIKMINYVSGESNYQKEVGRGTVAASDNGASVATVAVSVDETVELGTTKVKFLLGNDQTFGKPIVPVVQTQAGLGAENTNFFDYTYAYTVQNPTVAANTSFTLAHPFAYVKIPLKSSVYKGYSLRSVTLTNTESSTNSTGYPAGQISNINHTVPVFSIPAEDETARKNLLQGYVSGTTSSDVMVTYTGNVTVSDESQDAWLVALPTAIARNMPEPTRYNVTVEMEKDGKVVTALVKFKTILYPSAVNELNVGEIVEADVTDVEDMSTDFYAQYNAGKDIVIGDLTVNKTNYPDGVLKTPSEIDVDLLKAGGLIFIDDKDGAVVNLAAMTDGTSANTTIANAGELILIGRYKVSGKQTEIKMNEMRTPKALSVLNLRLTATYANNKTSMSQLFAKNSGDAASALRLCDCNIDATLAQRVILDKQGTASAYSNIHVENCVVKLNTAKTTSLYWLNAAEESTSAILTIKNNVIYRSSLVNQHAQVVYANNVAYPGLTMNIHDNTILNIHGMYGTIRYTSAADLNVSGNLAVNDAENTNNAALSSTYGQAKFVVGGTPTFVSEGGNYLTTIGWTDTSTITKFASPALTAASSDVFTDQVINPFSSMNYETGYFPVDASVVTNGAGASYSTKYYFSNSSAE